METIIFDGEGAVLGRMASVVAKELLKGTQVEIINSEKVIISGNKKNIITKIETKRNMGRGGSLKGPKYIRQEDKLLKRMIRGMIPRDTTKGREAIKRLRCHIGAQEEQKKNARTLKHQTPNTHTTLKEVVGGLK